MAKAKNLKRKRQNSAEGGFEPQAETAVLTVDEAILNQLIEKSLLPRAGNGRYEMHEFLRQFAQSVHTLSLCPKSEIGSHSEPNFPAL